MGWEEAVLYVACVCGVAVSLFCFVWGRGVGGGRNIPRTVRDDPAFDGILEGPVAAGEIVLQADSPKELINLVVLSLENPYQTTQRAWAKGGSASARIQIQHKSDNDVSFVGQNMSIEEGLVRIESKSSNTVRVRWAVQVSSARLLVMLGQLWALGLGFTLSIIIPFVLLKYVAYSSNPAIHVQIAQVAQITQTLWEPFLFIGLAKQRINATGKHLETTVAAAAYELRTGKPPQLLAT